MTPLPEGSAKPPEIQTGKKEAKEYLSLLRSFRQYGSGNHLPRALIVTKECLLDRITQTIEGIDRGVLDTILTDYPQGRDFTIGLVGKEDRFENWFDLHIVAADWNNPKYSGLRKVMEEEYRVGPIELEFLRTAYKEHLPRTILVVL